MYGTINVLSIYCTEVSTTSPECIVWRYYHRVLNVLYGGINNALNNVWRYQQRLKFIVWRYQQRLECIVRRYQQVLVVIVLYLGINVLNIVS